MELGSYYRWLFNIIKREIVRRVFFDGLVMVIDEMF